jgi:hypothetical protein
MLQVPIPESFPNGQRYNQAVEEDNRVGVVVNKEPAVEEAAQCGDA